MTSFALRQREWTASPIHSAPSADTSVRRAHPDLPSTSKKRFSVALSRPGAPQTRRPESWSTTTIRYRLAALIAHFINANAAQVRQRIGALMCIGHHTGDDRPNRAPGLPATALLPPSGWCGLPTMRIGPRRPWCDGHGGGPMGTRLRPPDVLHSAREERRPREIRESSPGRAPSSVCDPRPDPPKDSGAGRSRERRVAPLRGRTDAITTHASSSKMTFSTTVRSTPSSYCHSFAFCTSFPPVSLI